MGDFSLRSDGVDVEQIMRQIRMRIREKRGADYTEDQIRELANVRLERFIDPRKIQSGLLEEFRKRQEGPSAREMADLENMLYASHRLPVLRRIRRLLNPFLRLFFNPNALIKALHVHRRFLEKEQLDYEIMNNLVLEFTKLSIEVKNLRMRLESLSARLDFDEHRARALEGAVQYRPGVLAGAGEEEADAGGDESQEAPEGSARAARRRRRRRPRRRTGLTMPGEAAAVAAVLKQDRLSTEPAPAAAEHREDREAAPAATGGEPSPSRPSEPSEQ